MMQTYARIYNYRFVCKSQLIPSEFDDFYLVLCFLCFGFFIRFFLQTNQEKYLNRYIISLRKLYISVA
jgi:hypothetical protein